MSVRRRRCLESGLRRFASMYATMRVQFGGREMSLNEFGEGDFAAMEP